jgi:Bacterial Ig domain
VGLSAVRSFATIRNVLRMEIPAPVRQALTVLLFALPVVLYLWFISADGVDMLRADQWFDVNLIQSSFTGHLSFSLLWAQHGDNRIFFQNLVTLLLGHVVHYNVIVEEFISAALLIGAMALVIITHRRRAQRIHWIAYVPVAIVLLSVAQSGDTLFGFQVGWYLIMAALAVVLFLLDRPVLTRIAFCLAVAAGIVASFSSLQGLFIWPVGLALLLQRSRTRPYVLSWIASGVATTALYFFNWNTQESGGVSYALRHPVDTLRFFFFAIGNVVGVQIPNSPHGLQYATLVLGVAIVGVALWLLVNFGFRVDESSARPVGIALIWFGLLFAAAIAGGRVSFGLSDAGTTRYVTFDLLILVGSYLVVLERSPQSETGPVRGLHWLSGATAAVAILVGLQVVLGTANGIASGNRYRSYETTGAVVTVNIQHAPDGLVNSQLGAGFESAAFIRRMADDARVHHLSLYSTADIASYSKQALPVNRTPPTTVLLKPTAGSVLHGKLFFVASASDSFGITKLQFEVRANDGTSSVVDQGTPTRFGYVGGWDTDSVPNGTYFVRSIARSPGGETGVSPWILVKVAN